jgi:predicted P-loop ATPase
MTDNLVLKSALRYAELGFKVVPNARAVDGVCSCYRKDACQTPGKHPTIKEWTKNATSDPNTITEWYRKGLLQNIGLMTGIDGGFIVIDVDDDGYSKFGKETLEDLKQTLGELPDTVEQITGSGGQHLLFKSPEMPIKNNQNAMLGEYLDIRAEGGQIIVYPSVHPNGTRYEWELGATFSKDKMADLPQSWLNKILQNKKLEQNKQLKVPEEIKSGTRDATFFAMACSMWSKGFNEDEIFGALKEVNKRCDKPLDETQIWDKITSATKYEQGTSSIVNNIEKQNDLLVFDIKYCKFNSSTGKYKPLNLKENIEKLINFLKVDCKYNELTKQAEINIPKQNYSIDNQEELSLQHIYNECIKFDFSNISKDLIKAILLQIADENKYNPVKDYLETAYSEFKEDIEINGTEQLKTLQNTLVVQGIDDEFKNTLIEKWLISCVKAIYSEKGISAHGVLVLQGEQGIGKTTWFKKIVPNQNWFMDGITLDPSSKDSVSQAIKYWIVELGELGSTFKKDMDSLKQYLTKSIDEIRRPYARAESKYPRRTIFCGTVNELEFLKDDTGNRRFWVLPCNEINYNHNVNIKKLWAEVVYLEKQGRIHYLTQEETKILNENNKNFEAKNYIDTLIEDMFDWDKPSRYWLTSTDIFKLLGRGKELSATKIGIALSKRNIVTKAQKGLKYYSMPKATSYYNNWNYDKAPDCIETVCKLY